MPAMLKTYTVVLVLLVAGACASSSAPATFAATGGTSGGSVAPASPAPGSGSTTTGAIATWFGPGFYGKQTACGQTLTKQVVGVANRTLPCGTLVEVTYGAHSLTVPVLDRGPYGHGASWDLTAGAAQALGITETVHIVTHVVGKTANTPALGSPPSTTSTAPSGGALAG
jgi:rare lipoprotein A